MRAVPVTTDSSSPVRAAARARESSYPAQVRGPSGADSRWGAGSSVKLPGSVTEAMAARAESRVVVTESP